MDYSTLFIDDDFEDIYAASKVNEDETESYYRQHPKEISQVLKSFVLKSDTFAKLSDKIQNALRASVFVLSKSY